MAVEFRPVADGDARALASSLRPADRAEVLASDGLGALPALERSLTLSSEAYAGLIDGEVAALFGVRRVSLASRRGCPWLLTGAAVERHPCAFLRASRGVLGTWRRDYDSLANWVDARHVAALRWLGWLGFTLHPARPYGVRGLAFHPFELEGLLMTERTVAAPLRQTGEEQV
ncbi:MAG: hypothetical protein Kilf2KO_47830 [Rhodospirillales bacterium]